MLNNLVLLPINFKLFAAPNMNLNVTTDSSMGNDLSPEMKTYYEKQLIREMKPKLPHQNFGQKKTIPMHGGDQIEFRKFSKLPLALTPLTEGVTPDGLNLNVTKITAKVAQYGAYVALSDKLMITTIDPVLQEANRLLADQAAETMDTICREVLVGGTNVIYSGEATDRENLAGGDKTGKANCYLTVDDIQRAVRNLEVQSAPKFGEYYMAIIHPDVVYDLKHDPRWEDPHTYKDTEELYTGELGRIEGVRFIRTPAAKMWKNAGTGWQTDSAVPSSRDVYATLIFGRDAYGVVGLAGSGLEYIFKPKGSAGTADALNQRATSGWKASTVTVRLMETYMIRIESCSTFQSVA